MSSRVLIVLIGSIKNASFNIRVFYSNLLYTEAQMSTLTKKNEDLTPLSLSDINGYRIYYGASAGNYPNSADVTDGTATSVTVTGVPVGTYYLVMTTYDVAGRESRYSSAVRKTAL